MIATLLALAWANTFGNGYIGLWERELTVGVGSLAITDDLRHWVNDGLMALFFFVVGLEIKRELVTGELRDRRAAALPVLAALGGAILPALIFLAITAGGAGGAGWGIPMATDIAFALGVVALLGRRVPPPVKLLLLTLAIVDDIGAIAVIAIFYSDGLRPGLLLVGVALVALIAAMHRVDVIYPPLIVIAAIALWMVVYESGVHATIAGVIVGLLTPARPIQTELEAEEIVDVLENRGDLRADEIRATARLIGGSVSACDRLIDAVHPWTSYLIVPVFALGNAGIELSGDAFTDPSDILVGVGFALVAGKLLGITAFSWIAVRLGLGRLPDGAGWPHIIGVGALAGIGFTVSLFITGLAFDNAALQDDAKIGVLAASVTAAVLGALLLGVADRRRPDPVQDAERIGQAGTSS